MRNMRYPNTRIFMSDGRVRYVNLIPGAVHVIDEHTGNFCKNLTCCFLSDVCVEVLYTNNLILLAGPQPCSFDVWQSGRDQIVDRP